MALRCREEAHWDEIRGMDETHAEEVRLCEALE